MHKLLDRLDDISEEMRNMQPGFADSEKIALNSLRETAQNILKKIYDVERSIVSANLENRIANMTASIAMIIDPDSTGSRNLSQIASQGESRQDFRLKNMDLAHHSISNKIKKMDVQKIFEFLDIFSKKDLHNTILPELGHIRQIPVVEQIPIVVESSSKIDVVKTSPKRIEVPLVPIKIKQD